MPDIAICVNTECPRRMDCYRYRAIPDEYQTMFKPNADTCQHFWPIEPGHRLAALEQQEG